MEEINIKTSKTARVYFSNNITSKTEEIVFAIHGYAQLGKYFIKKFDSIISDNRVVVVPEALNKFYWNGMNGRVVASWMTKEDRESEIDDYIEYLNQVYEIVTKKAKKNVKITVFGFSQGTATSSRWISSNPNLLISKFILWAGGFPKEVLNDSDIYNKMKIINVIGDKDEYISLTDFENHLNDLKMNSFNPNPIVFDGNHVVDIKKTPDLFL